LVNGEITARIGIVTPHIWPEGSLRRQSFAIGGSSAELLQAAAAFGAAMDDGTALPFGRNLFETLCAGSSAWDCCVPACSKMANGA
jgi:hypothetical protein